MSDSLDQNQFRMERHCGTRLELAESADQLVSLVRASSLEWWGTGGL